jgi:hypothetical protein
MTAKTTDTQDMLAKQIEAANQDLLLYLAKVMDAFLTTGGRVQYHSLAMQLQRKHQALEALLIQFRGMQS